MKNFHFDQITDRRNTFSYKWDIKEGELPMWVADMDFETAPCVREALIRRAEHGIFGYSVVPQEWNQAICGWWQRRHGFQMQEDWLIFCTGVIPAIDVAVKRMTNVGDNVVVQTPVYNIFYNCIENHGRHVLENRLLYENGQYEMDFADLEEKLAHPQTTMLLLCNPQNPAGKIWSKEELARVGALCKKHHVLVVADEIHCDLTMPGYAYVPFASVSDECKYNSITCLAPSKTFNMAGLQSAAVMIPDEAIRERMDRGLNSDEVAEPNAFAMAGTIAAFTEGDAWLDSLRHYLQESRDMVAAFLAGKLPQIHLVENTATYLLWLDCSKVTDDTDHLQEFIRKETGLYLSRGSSYHGNGNLFLRMNIACPHAVLKDGLERFAQGIQLFEKTK